LISNVSKNHLSVLGERKNIGFYDNLSLVCKIERADENRKSRPLMEKCLEHQRTVILPLSLSIRDQRQKRNTEHETRNTKRETCETLMPDIHNLIKHINSNLIQALKHHASEYTTN